MCDGIAPELESDAYSTKKRFHIDAHGTDGDNIPVGETAGFGIAALLTERTAAVAEGEVVDSCGSRRERYAADRILESFGDDREFFLVLHVGDLELLEKH